MCVFVLFVVEKEVVVANNKEKRSERGNANGSLRRRRGPHITTSIYDLWHNTRNIEKLRSHQVTHRRRRRRHLLNTTGRVLTIELDLYEVIFEDQRTENSNQEPYKECTNYKEIDGN